VYVGFLFERLDFAANRGGGFPVSINGCSEEGPELLGTSMRNLYVLLERHHWGRAKDIGQHVSHGVFRQLFLRVIVPHGTAPVPRDRVLNFAPPNRRKWQTIWRTG
jgi:hypothetical protein